MIFLFQKSLHLQVEKQSYVQPAEAPLTKE